MSELQRDEQTKTDSSSVPETNQTDTTYTPSVPEEKAEHPLTEIIRFTIIALIIVIPIRMFVAQPFIVSGASMDDTFASGQYLIVDQVSYYLHKPQRGDVVIFRYPRDPSKFFIKRVIGVPGDTIIIDGDTVKLRNDEYPRGVVLDEPYITSMLGNDSIEEELGEREYFVMGDNRDESSDSRAWGVLQEDRIVGRAFLRLFPPTEFDILPGEYVIDSSTISSNVEE